MKQRAMGSLGWPVSALGFGAMRLPGQRFNRLIPDQAKSTAIIRSGIDQGINYVDTAYVYPGSEKAVGVALRDGYRDRVRLVTKLPVFLTRKTQDFDKYLSTSLERLQTDHLDAYLLHAMNAGGFEKVQRLGLLDKMVEARDAGLIRHIGFSFHDTLPVFKHIVDAFDWDLCQIQLNYMDTCLQAGTEGLEYAAGKGIAVVVMEPLKGGTLANPPAEAREIMHSSGVDRTPVDWALQFLWNRPEVSCVISGMGSQQMVDDNCASADRSGVATLTAHELDIVEQLADVYRRRMVVPCTACRYCMPCPYGVNIPQNFAIWNNVSMKDGGWQSRRIKSGYRKLARTSAKVNLEKPNGSAVVCTKCGACVPKCPQEIDIPTELEKCEAALR
ncbi:MAG: aldo/keto reductase [Coriobacteriia bacterium]|nr:aldo/keto reductase [Coriobacteriia bacterium]